MKKIECLKIGEIFHIGKTPYVRDTYNRETKKYSCYKWHDISSFREFNKGKLVDTTVTF